ncbi:MAG: PQQ-binding-like beta-propeller repeat protein [bacterium]
MRKILMLIVTLALAATLYAADAVPLGHPDFYPSPERPLGWRGDGTGAWPGADVVATWNADTGDNIVWKVETPGAGLCQPIVVGEKLFITADPNLLLCYNVNDGKLLWQTAIDHTLCMNEEDRKAAREEQAFFDGKWKEYCEWRQSIKKLETLILKTAGIGPKPDQVKERDAYKKWQNSRSAVLNGMYVRARMGTRVVESTDPGYVTFGKLLADNADVKQLYDTIITTQQAEKWQIHNGNGNGLFTDEPEHGPSGPLRKRYTISQQKYNIWYTGFSPWYGITSHSFATPVTDGKYIYVTTANNAVAAVDLNGNVAWITWEYFPKRAGPMGTQYVASPLLIDGKLVVNQMAYLRAYDATNGKKIWGVWAPTTAALGKKTVPVYAWRGDPEGCSPVGTHLTLPDGGQVAVISDGNSAIWRLEDGKLLTAGMPYHGCGSTAIMQGDLYAWNAGGDTNAEYEGVIRLKAENRDKVVIEPVWLHHPGGGHQSTPVINNGKFYADLWGKHSKVKGIAEIVDLNTGKTVGTFGPGMGKSNHSPIIAGSRIYG